jgi:hypothetical protein
VPSTFEVVDNDGRDAIILDGPRANISIGARAHISVSADSAIPFTPRRNAIVMRNTGGHDAILLNGQVSSIVLYDADDRPSIVLDGLTGNIALRGADGRDVIYLNRAGNSILLRNAEGQDSIELDGQTGTIALRDADGRDVILLNRAANSVALRRANGQHSIVLDGLTGNIAVRDDAGNDSVVLNGVSGDITLKNADCAEEFDVSAAAEAEPGTVMVLDPDGRLRPSSDAYDKKVAGVISGAGGFRLGIVLDKQHHKEDRMPVALMGKAFCKVDAGYAPIEVGDLLTTSSTPGHAMKASDPTKAFGAVIGKALHSRGAGAGLIPILITLQ